ncbi:YaiI/YqxD family protein [Gracilibacillus sp. S3-1-1]|uniref:YaiI/YqxD family protein n=1 Tax=Gracilibacillus pellucidus TaxID=3095368 RepID=A0ACC6M5Q3_9BACI|nr:YaiI/YqxD family protein [Gracilibacillus sp. S3-1-1]MDX8046216.1 YaiI/YqxD family protein [Gracilibacillus sp. S3-1-1]
MNIYVDADACPVTDMIIEEAKLFQLDVVLVKSYSHFSMKETPSHVSIKYVDDGADAADYRIVQMVKHGDVVVTQDYGLAALCLEKGCHVIHHIGFRYTKDKIDQMLQERHINAQARKAGIRTKGPKKFSEEQKNSFRLKLRKLLEQSS